MKFYLPIAMRFLILIGSCFIVIDARPQATVSGPFGTVQSPNDREYAEIELKTGELISAKRLEEEHDTLFAILLDYRYMPIPIESISRINIKDTQETISENRNRRGVFILLLMVSLVFVTAYVINEKQG